MKGGLSAIRCEGDDAIVIFEVARKECSALGKEHD